MENSNLSTDSIWTIVVIVLALVVLQIAAMWRIYEKAGKPGWASLIPFYNIFVLLQIVKKPEWWLVWYFLPIANIVVSIWVTNLLSKSFGKNEAFTLGLIFLSIIFYPILGFGNSAYQGGAGAPKVTQINV
ncbi:MAG: signal peptidase I [Bacteroidales bacterium]|nr:signal peptidase I [Bacteroidales bacterium]